MVAAGQLHFIAPVSPSEKTGPVGRPGEYEDGAMTRRVIKDEMEFEAFRETKSTVRRLFHGSAVLNVLQWLKPDISRFTVEGEGIEVWCCPKTVPEEQTIPLSTARGAL
jgi:hypothetical protein